MKNMAFFSLLFSFAVFLTASAKDFDVRDFGAVGDGKTKNTLSIQKAIDECSRTGGGVVKFEGGRYLTGMIFLKDSVTLEITVSATLLGSPNDSDYPTNIPLKHLVKELCPRGRGTALIVADQCRNIGIKGAGKIDCNGHEFVELARTREYGYTSNGDQVGKEVPGGLGDNWVNWKYRRKKGYPPPRMVLFAGCSDVSVSDISLVNPAAGWGFWATDCDRVIFDKVKVLADPEKPNNDGFHINCSRDVVISNCRVVAGDDAIKIRANGRALAKGGTPACERVIVSNCSLQSHAGAISFGWIGDGVIRDCVFSNITISDSASGIDFVVPRFEEGMTDVGTAEPRFENISFGAITMDRIYSSPISLSFSCKKKVPSAIVKNVSFTDVRCKALRFPSFSSNSTCPMEDVVFRGCSFTRVSDEDFPEKWEKKGAAWWTRPMPERFMAVRGLRYDGCTFDDLSIEK